MTDAPSAKQIEEDRIAINAYNSEIKNFDYESDRHTSSLVGLSLGGIAIFIISALIVWKESTLTGRDADNSTGTVNFIFVLIMLFGAPITWGVGITESDKRYNSAKDQIQDYNNNNDAIMRPIFERAAKYVDLYEPPKEKIILLQKEVDDASKLYKKRLLAINIVGGLLFLIFFYCFTIYLVRRGQLKTAVLSKVIDLIMKDISNFKKAAIIFGIFFSILLIFGNIFGTIPSKNVLDNKKKDLERYQIANIDKL